MTTWNDFNSADDQNNFDLIPKGTLVKVRMTIRPGGYDDASQGWTLCQTQDVEPDWFAQS